MKIKQLIMMLLLLFIIPISSVMAAGEKYDEAYELFTGLGIVDEAPEDIDTAITRGEFTELYIKSLNKSYIQGDSVRPFTDLPSTHKNYDSICLAYNYGYISGYADGTFQPDKKITVAECVNMALRALGYTSNMSSNECVSDLYEGTSIKDEFISYKDAVIFIYNMMREGRVVYDPPKSYRIDENNTILSVSWDVSEIEGQITANGMTSLNSKQGCKVNGVQIGGYVYECSDKVISDMLGHYVNAYIREIDGVYHIISIISEKSKSVNIKSYELYDGSYVDNKIIYHKNGEGKQTTIKLRSAVDVIYNDVFAGSQLEPGLITNMNLGEVILIDSEDDGYYDVMKIYNYDILTAGNFTTSNALKIYDLYNNRTYINFEQESSGDIINVEIDGRKAQPADIMTGDVLAFYESETSNGKILNVKINRTVTTGTLESIGDREFIIDGKSFRINPMIKDAAENNYGGVPTIGIISTFCMDYLNQIVIVKGENQPDVFSGVLIRLGYDPDQEIFFVKMLTQANSVETYYSNNKLIINGIEVKNLGDALDIVDISKLSGCTNDAITQLVHYKLDDDGKISFIYTSSYDNENAPKADGEFKKRSYKNLGFVFGAEVREFRVDQNTDVFTVPTEALTTSKPDYEACFANQMDRVQNGDSYDCQAYDVDESGIADSILIVRDITESYPTSPTYYLVSSNREVVDENGDIRRELKVVSKKIQYTYRTRPYDTETCSEIEPGDIIKMVLDPNEDIVFTETILDISAPKILQGFSDPTSYTAVRYFIGYLSTYSNGWGYLTYDASSSSDIAAEPLRDLVNVGGISASLYNVESRTVTDAQAVDFAKYISTDGSDYMIFYAEAYGQSLDMVIYEF